MGDRRGSVESPPSPYRSSARLTPPMDPWRARGLNPQPQYGHNTGPHLQHNRPVLPQLPPPPVFGQHFPPTGGPHIPPNMGNQRLYTPRSSYFGPQTNQPFINSSAQSSAVNAGRQYDTGGGGFQDQDYRTTSTSAPAIQRHNPYADSSRPVWPPDATQRADDANDLYANIDIDNIDSLRDALQNANRLAGGATAGTAPIAADSTTLTVTETVASTAATNDPMTELIARMQVIDAELSAKMESSRKAKSEIEVLDAALKDYEYKFKLRNNLRLASDAIDKDVDQLNKRRTALTAEMKVYNESHRSSSGTSLPTPIVAPIARPPVDHSSSSLLSTTSTADERQGQSSQRTLQQKERPQHLRPTQTTHSSPTAAKRPNISHTKPAANPKRVRINDVVSNTTPKALLRTTPSLHTGLKPAIKRTPHPFRPKPALGTPTTPSATASPSTDSPKVSRLCRQQTPGPGGPRSTGLAPAPSGVRTSRPVRPGCSRANRTDNESTEAPEPSEPTHTSDQPMDNTEADTAVDSADEVFSDNEIFNELVNTNIMNEKAAEKDAPVVTNPTPNTATTAATATQSTVNSDEILDNSVATGDQRDGPSPQPAPQDNAIDTGGEDRGGNDGPNVEPDVVTIDSDDSDDEVFTAETQPTINVKKEKPDAMNGGNHSLNAAATRVLSDSVADLNASSAASDDSMASTSTSSTLSSNLNRKSLRYTGFPAVEYERTDGQEYTLGPFKPIFGPKSKTAGVGVIAMKAFKDYLIASFADNTVRRFHIQNKSDVGMYGPHGNHVMALMIVESAKCADHYYLYTACKDKALRVFNARTTQLIGGISLGHSIYCLDYRWSHVFCGLEDGSVCKVAAIHELESPPQVAADGAANTGGDTYEHLIKRYVVNAKKRILAVVAVKATAREAVTVDIEPVVAVTQNKLRVVNTSNSVVNDKDRVLHSMPLNASNTSRIFAKVFGDYLFLAFKVVGFKPEGQTKPDKADDKSLLLMYDLQKDWNYVNKLEIMGVISAVEMSGADLLVCEYSGNVQCFACGHQFGLKWKAHPLVTISACVQLGSRLVLGTGSGQFEVIFLDQNRVDCELCGITFVREMDLKHHIKIDHNLSEPPAIGQ